MGEMKKRKLDEIGDSQLLQNLNETPSFASVEELRALLDPLAKPHLVDVLSRAGSQYPSIAEEIRSVSSADPVLLQKHCVLHFKSMVKLKRVS